MRGGPEIRHICGPPPPFSVSAPDRTLGAGERRVQRDTTAWRRSGWPWTVRKLFAREQTVWRRRRRRPRCTVTGSGGERRRGGGLVVLRWGKKAEERTRRPLLVCAGALTRSGPSPTQPNRPTRGLVQAQRNLGAVHHGTTRRIKRLRMMAHWSSSLPTCLVEPSRSRSSRPGQGRRLP